MLPRIDSIVQRDCCLDRNLTILLGVSGGADSLCLMDVLHSLGYPLVIAHLDHGIRPESGLDSANVLESAASLGITAVSQAVSAPGYAGEHNLSLEESARILRYRFLFEQATIHEAQAVAVAHNADDQVETLLMHLLRGSGLDGLTGMSLRSLPNPWSSTVPLVRPLLGIWRHEIDAYCRERGLEPILDRTNLDTQYFRNRLRHELVPELETYVPGIRQRLWQTAALINADRQILDTLTDLAWQNLVFGIGPDFTTFSLPAFLSQPVGFQRRLVRKSVSGLRPEARDIDYALVQRVLDFVIQPTQTHQADIGLGLGIFLEGDLFHIRTWETPLPADEYPQIVEELVLALPGEWRLGSGWVLSAEIVMDVEAARKSALANQDPYRAWIDPADSPRQIILRSRHPGDRFCPLGMDGRSLKLSDYMLNRKIPARLRGAWPLLCLDDQVAWVPGHHLSHHFRLTRETKQVISLQVRPI
jgi:tRNA(Ile)-lysidine synthase